MGNKDERNRDKEKIDDKLGVSKCQEILQNISENNFFNITF